MFFKQVMGFDDQKRGSSFKTNPAFDTYNSVSYMDVSANPKFFGLIL